MRKTIAQHMKDILIEDGSEFVMWGDCYYLDECYGRSGMKTRAKHPLDRHIEVLNRLEKSKLFRKRLIWVHVVGGDGVSRERKKVYQEKNSEYWSRVRSEKRCGGNRGKVERNQLEIFLEGHFNLSLVEKKLFQAIRDGRVVN